jgi:SNF2 family DNA or RNA helicase
VEAKKEESPDMKLLSKESSEESDADEEILDESAFEEEQKADAWAEGVVAAASKDPLANLPEMPDPKGLTVTLRPYQRQALSWMWKRETDPSNRDVVEKELKLLSELARNKTQQQNASIDAYQNQQTTADIFCDCGPVLVSKEGTTKSTTIDGEVDPVTHPLWQRRFLAYDDMQSSISFYVNELIGIASDKSPNPPKQCVGGIQADAMGLGKTVMLLALLLQSKIEEDSGTTLVVAPLSLIAQWEEELASKTNLTHKVYYGDSAKLGIGKTTFKGTDVVVTTCKKSILRTH